MGSDPLMLMAQAILRAGMQQARAFTRDWLLPVISPAVRNSSANPEAGEPHANLVHHQSAVGYNGTNTMMPFTANVSFIEASGLSDDIVVG